MHASRALHISLYINHHVQAVSAVASAPPAVVPGHSSGSTTAAAATGETRTFDAFWEATQRELAARVDSTPESRAEQEARLATVSCVLSKALSTLQHQEHVGRG
jgi:hypothetical protein